MMRFTTRLSVPLVVAGLFAAGIAYAQTPANPPNIATPDMNAMAKPSGPVTGGLPKWSEFPVPPTNVPSVAEFARRVNVANQKEAALNAEVQALVWDKDVPVTLGDQIHSRIDPAMLKPVDQPLQAQEIEALAASLRARATPPQIVK